MPSPAPHVDGVLDVLALIEEACVIVACAFAVQEFASVTVTVYVLEIRLLILANVEFPGDH